MKRGRENTVKVAREVDEQKPGSQTSEGWLSRNKGFLLKMAEGKMVKSSWGTDGVGPCTMLQGWGVWTSS